jgi:RNA polymerase sigma-70 factor (ECF subfamily)
VQETLLKGFRALDSLKPGTSPKSWLLTILRNTHVDHLRKKAGKALISLDGLDTDLPAVQETPVAPDTSLDALLEQFGDAQLVEALRDLPSEIGWSVLLVDVEGLTYPEAADIMSVPVGTAKSRVFRGRTMLREAIALNVSGGARRLGER